MKRGLFILLAGFLAAFGGFWLVYRAGTAASRELMESAQPELAWLKHEFNLGEAEFNRVAELHAAYLPKCMERCRRIEELNEQFSRALAAATQLTPELESLLKERAQMRAQCQAEMLKHFFDVSRTMAPAQSERYLTWVRLNTCLREQPMEHGSGHEAGSPVSAHRP